MIPDTDPTSPTASGVPGAGEEDSYDGCSAPPRGASQLVRFGPAAGWSVPQWPAGPAWRIAEAVRGGEITARAVVEATLERIATLDPPLRAFVAIAPERALAAADEIDARVAAGQDPGPLAGVPIGVKDLEPVAGLPFTCGSRLYADRVADSDSVQVARLVAAGAIVVGKTNTSEFGAIPYTVNQLHGSTGNPWDPAKTPGGSSGGSATAIAAGMVPLATGSDGGGSIRIPAAWCGCFGMKPTFGRIPRDRDAALSWGPLTHPGVLAASVRDAARYLDVVCGPHAADPDCLEAPADSFEAAVLSVYGDSHSDTPLRRGAGGGRSAGGRHTPGGLDARRVALSATLGYAVVDPSVSAVAQAAAARLAEASGAELVEVDDLFDDPLDTWLALAAPGDYAFLSGLGPAERELLEPAFFVTARIGERMTAADYARALEERRRLNQRLSALFETYDLLLTPTTAAQPFSREGPPPRSIAGRDVGPNGVVPFTHPFNITGHPAASVPAGIGPEGMPVGLQVVGPRFADALVLRACALLERRAFDSGNSAA